MSATETSHTQPKPGWWTRKLGALQTQFGGEKPSTFAKPFLMDAEVYRGAAHYMSYAT